ncbi:DNA repair protein [Pseudomonas sp. Fig-3]|jgi:hypothetical protein|uniref:DNA repair protein n=1 Tax=Pseudomonas rhizophila TaxID=2045200 RepID=A0ABN5JWK9_9PSED|nr:MULTISPECIES: DUF6388 family protein [Pseudomonas]AVU76520.1 DNA repair protein [Pseudomonas rhizophila]MDR8386599.1 DUF6388 family protein [Pseudomonas sp. JL2]MXR30915.1 DNA repair protein [Pseudomonas sp. PICF6]QKJ36590.1 DNA repair protein [Pseudomonas sp. MPDS]TNB80046.1 DNA repair protein [Pseudomonas sp. Fig-3]
MAATEQQHERALEKFLDARPDLRVELDNLNPLLAQAKGETAAQYRAERLHEAFEAEAEHQGLFAWELTLQLTATSPQDYENQRMEVHKEVAQMAGMEWAEYCELNGLKNQG